MINEIDSPNKTLTYKKIFIFWYPLAATWLMMGVENPFLAAIIARLPEPKYNLAAFGVAFAFALIIEAPIIMIMSAATKLVTNADAFYKLRKFTYTINIIITLILFVGLIPSVFFYIAEQMIGLPREVAKLTHIATILLIPWPAAIGYRRFYHGVMIRYNFTRRVAYSTTVRLLTMASTATLLYFLNVKGAYVGAAALSMGVMLEAIVSRFLAHNAVTQVLQQNGLPGNDTEKEKSEKKILTYGGIAKFYYPLALMTLLSLGVHPLVTFFVGKSRFPLESLAVLPVVNALLFLFRSVGLSFTEVAVALLGENNRNYLPLRNFAMILAAIVISSLFFISFTPLASLWYGKVSGLSAVLTDFSIWPTRLLALLPGLTVFISVQRAVLVNTNNTSPISRATAIEVAVIMATLFIGITYLNAVGAVAAAMSYTLGRLCANIYLLPHQFRAVAKE
jgi:progressive ankylosis protein